MTSCWGHKTLRVIIIDLVLINSKKEDLVLGEKLIELHASWMNTSDLGKQWHLTIIYT
jgi:hypothetical protein